MGNQQILLLIVGTIIVGIAVTIGITQAREYYDNSVGDELQSSLLRVVQDAIVYYEKPTSLGGGGKSFKGFVMPHRTDEIALYTQGNLTNGLFFVGYSKNNFKNQLMVSVKYYKGFIVDWDGWGSFTKYATKDYVPL